MTQKSSTQHPSRLATFFARLCHAIIKAGEVAGAILALVALGILVSQVVWTLVAFLMSLLHHLPGL